MIINNATMMMLHITVYNFGARGILDQHMRWTILKQSFKMPLEKQIQPPNNSLKKHLVSIC